MEFAERVVEERWFFDDRRYPELVGWYITKTIHTPNGLGGYLTRTVSIVSDNSITDGEHHD